MFSLRKILKETLVMLNRYNFLTLWACILLNLEPLISWKNNNIAWKEDIDCITVVWGAFKNTYVKRAFLYARHKAHDLIYPQKILWRWYIFSMYKKWGLTMIKFIVQCPTDKALWSQCQIHCLQSIPEARYKLIYHTASYKNEILNPTLSPVFSM